MVVFSCPELGYQYDSDTAEAIARESAPNGIANSFTTLLGCNADGKLLPAFILLKCDLDGNTSVDNATIDMLKKVLDTLPDKAQWEEKMFTTVLEVEGGHEVQYIRPFLIHNDTLDIITIHNKTWNDTVGELLSIEYQLKPIRLRGKQQQTCLMVVDHARFPTSQAVCDAYTQAGWIVHFLPPYMSDELQPINLIVNKQFKSVIKSRRSSSINESLDTYRTELQYYYTNLARGNAYATKPIWRPTPLTYKAVIPQVLSCLHHDFNEEYFVKSLKSSFRWVGLCRRVDQVGDPLPWERYEPPTKQEDDDNDNGVSHHNSTSSCVKFGPEDCIGKIIVDFVARNEVNADDDDEGLVLGEGHTGGGGSSLKMLMQMY